MWEIKKEASAMKIQIEAVGSDDIFEGYWETTTGKTLYPVE